MCTVIGTYLCPACGMLYSFEPDENPDKNLSIDKSFFLSSGSIVHYDVIDGKVNIRHGDIASTFPYKRFYHCDTCNEELKIKMSLLIFAGFSYAKDEKTLES